MSLSDRQNSNDQKTKGGDKFVINGGGGGGGWQVEKVISLGN